MNRLLIVGCGDIALRALPQLARDYQVFGLVRSAAQAERIAALGALPLMGDLDNPASLTALSGVADLVLHLAPPGESGERDQRSANLIAALSPRPPARLVYISTSGVYGDCAGELVSEARVPAPATLRAKHRLAAEQMLQDWCSKTTTRCIIFRVPGIYGPGRLGLDRIASGQAYIRESDANPGNRIHADDLASASIAALERSNATGIYNICDGDFRSGTWFALTVAKLAGLHPPPLVSRAEAHASMSPARLSFLVESRRLDTRKMREVLRFEPEYANAEDGIRASLREGGLLGDQSA